MMKGFEVIPIIALLSLLNYDALPVAALAVIVFAAIRLYRRTTIKQAR